MKIPSTTHEGSTQSSTSDSSSTAGPVLNEALFNQILQLLSALPESPAEAMTGQMSDGQATATEGGSQLDNIINKLFGNMMNMQANMDAKNDTDTTQNTYDVNTKPANFLDNMFNTTGQHDKLTDETLPAQNDALKKVIAGLNLNVAGNQELAKQLQDFKQSPATPGSSMQADESAVPVLQNAAQPKKTANSLLSSSGLLDQEIDKSMLFRQGFGQEAMISTNKPETMQSPATQTLFQSSAAESAKSTTADITMTALDLPNKSKIDLNNKFNDLFANIGQLINARTSQLDSPAGVNTNVLSQTAAQTQPDLNMLSAGHFDPLHDLKLAVSTSSIGSHLREIYDAKIKVYPPELGHIVANLKIDKNNAELVIMTENNQVKQIVESNLSLLMQQFKDANINLSQVDVQSNQFSGNGQENNQSNHLESPPFTQQEPPKTSKSTTKESKKSDNAIIDTYA